jgi:4-diphosphocytidyl-2-C-methyl-D-erythritol kinase
LAVRRVRAFAKINLTLRVLGVRPDGYHELSTTFQTLALHDTLTFTTSRGPFDIRCSDLACPVDRTNLVWRAAEEVWRADRRRGEPEGVRVRLDKRIPLQAGLGGGSSDAAATLRVLPKLWRVRVSPARLARIAAKLGADVPFFLSGGTAFGLGRGDRLQWMDDLPPRWVALVLPDFGVSTKDAYDWWDREHADEDEDFPSPSAWRIPVAFRRRDDVRNDLEPLVAERHPEIGQIVAELKRAGAVHAAMSGSGSAVFGLFSTRLSAKRATEVLAAASRRTIVTRTLDRARYQALAHPWSKGREGRRRSRL